MADPNEDVVTPDDNMEEVTEQFSMTSFTQEGDTGSESSARGSTSSDRNSRRSSSGSKTYDPEATNGSAITEQYEFDSGHNYAQDTDLTTWNSHVTGDNGATSKSSKSKNPFKFLKRLSLRQNKEKEKEKDVEEKPKVSKFDKILNDVTVDALPQVFVTKYMGFKPCDGLWGIKHTRGPVDEMIADITAAQTEDDPEDLPLVQIRVSLSGVHTKEHSANACKTKRVEKGLIPIEFISYGVQDIRYTRVFAFILVREMSSKNRKLECHAYVCDSTVNCRKMSLSVAMAFQEYSKTLEGKPYKFKVDLQSSKEAEEETEPTPGEDFEV